MHNFLGIDERTKGNLLTFDHNVRTVYSNIKTVYPSKNHPESTEDAISTAQKNLNDIKIFLALKLSDVFIQFINVKMPTTVVILTFISRINFTSS